MPKEVHNALTPTRIKQERKPGRYADGNGLYLQVSDTGARWWIWRGSVHSKRIERGMGSARLIPLAEARETARQWRRISKDGGDPAIERDKDKLQAMTFEDAARQVWGEQIQPHAKNPKDSTQWLTTLSNYAFPHIGSRPIGAITSGDVLRVLAPIWTEKQETARRVRQRVRTVFDWARTAGHFDGVNPVEGVEKGLPKQRDLVKHHRAMPYQQLPEFMRRLDDVDGIGVLALRFAILTACRGGEVRKAEWSEVDGDARLWAIPSLRMKSEREHRVPLSDEAWAVLDQVRGLSTGLVFPGSRQGRPLSDVTLTAVLKRLDAQTTVHGMRSTFRDWTEDMTSFSREVKEAALAHTIRDKVEAAYRRGDLFEKRRVLMDQWGRWCGSAQGGGKVVEMRG